MSTEDFTDVSWKPMSRKISTLVINARNTTEDVIHRTKNDHVGKKQRNRHYDSSEYIL